MVKKIKLYSHIGKYQENKEYIKVDEDLEIDFEFDVEPNCRVIAIINNGKDTIKKNIENKKIFINSDFIRFGELNIKVQVINDETIIQEFNCEKLVVKEDKNIVYSVPEIEILKAQIDGLKILTEILQEKVVTLTNLVSGLYGIDIKVGDNND